MSIEKISTQIFFETNPKTAPSKGTRFLTRGLKRCQQKIIGWLEIAKTAVPRGG
jgi:hypothetical protein